MKRSHINSVIKDMEKLLEDCHFYLPPFASWHQQDFLENKDCAREIFDNRLGWDITDYGTGRFMECGFALFTIRNGNVKSPQKYPKTYAEKVLMLYPSQFAPTHYHVNKMEDIINRGGNDVYIGVWNGDASGHLLDSDVIVSLDGVRKTFKAGSSILLHPGESITITPYLYHNFTAKDTGGPVLLGEVSMCNDDEHDNYFYEPIGRFPEIEEDEEAYRVLCFEYDNILKN
jgi:hypothetical protein